MITPLLIQSAKKISFFLRAALLIVIVWGFPAITEASTIFGLSIGTTYYSSKEFTQVSGVTNGETVSSGSSHIEVMKTGEKLDDRALNAFNYALNLGFFLRTPTQFFLPLQYKFTWLFIPGLFEANQTGSVQINHQIQVEINLPKNFGLGIAYLLQTDFLYQQQNTQYISFGSNLEPNSFAISSIVASFFSGGSLSLFWNSGEVDYNWRICGETQVYALFNSPFVRFAVSGAYFF